MGHQVSIQRKRESEVKKPGKIRNQSPERKWERQHFECWSEIMREEKNRSILYDD
jgi:hypothetical protein